LETNVIVKISERINDEDWKLLQSFCERAQRLASTKILTEGKSAIHCEWKWEKDRGLRYEVSLPPEEQIAEFLMAFRFFYLQKERTFFPKILNLIGKYSKQEDVLQALKITRERWNNFLLRKTMLIEIDGKQLDSSMLLDLWFNAYYFHSDEKKLPELNKLKNVITEDVAKYLLLDAAYEATKLILALYNGFKGMVNDHFASLGGSE